MTQPSSNTPDLKKTLLSIGIIIVAVWLLGHILHLAAALLNLVLAVAAVLLILWIVQNYLVGRKK